MPGCSDKNKHFIRLVLLKMLYGQTLKCMQILCMESWSCSSNESNSGCIFKSQRCSLINMESLRITLKGLKFMQYQDYPLEGNFSETLDFARLPSMLLAFLLAMNNFTEILFSFEKQIQGPSAWTCISFQTFKLRTTLQSGYWLSVHSLFMLEGRAQDRRECARD